MTIGETLKRARKKMGLELDDVVRSTKIAKMFLIALENDDISSLPQGVYTRNFLRTYARFLKLDEDILTAEYHDQYSIKPQFVTQQEQTKLDNQRFVRRRNKRLMALAIGIAVPVCLYLLYMRFQEPLDLFFASFLQSKAETVAPVRTGTQPDVVTATVSADVPSEPEVLTDAGETAGNSAAEDSAEAPLPAASEPVTDSEASEETGDGVPPDPSAGAVGQQSEASDQSAPPSGEFQWEKALPLTDTLGVTFHGADETPPAGLEETFVIAGRGEPVWIQVFIDGREISNRRLMPGQVRCYRYGRKNTVVIGDAFQVSVQDGFQFRDAAYHQKVFVKLDDFGPGEFFSALDDAVAKTMAQLKSGEETP